MQLPPDSLIQFSLQKMQQQLLIREQQGYTGQIRSGLIYAGNIHDAIPRQLLLDNRLSPIDKLCWIMIRLHAQQNDGAVFPTYDELQLQLATPHSHKASRETISRALLILRLTGWLSLCNRVRDSRGRIRGNIYIQHDEPLNAYDAETLDPRWLDLLEKSCQHNNKSVRHVASTILIAAKDDSMMRHQHTRLSLIEQRLAAVQTPTQLAVRQKLILSESYTISKKATASTQSIAKNRTRAISAKTPSTKIELSQKASNNTTVRKSNHNNVRNFTQSVKDTYVETQSLNTELITPQIKQTLSPQESIMLEKQLQQLPSELAHSIITQLMQGLQKGHVRNPVAYALTLLKSARNGSYKPFITQQNKHSKQQPVDKNQQQLQPSEQAQDQSQLQPAPAYRTADPTKIKQTIANIRRRLLGINIE